MKRKNKYNNKKVTIDGIIFDSYMESQYYKYLKELQQQGIVKSYDLQVPFILRKRENDIELLNMLLNSL